jgi:peroxiredoxin
MRLAPLLLLVAACSRSAQGSTGAPASSSVPVSAALDVGQPAPDFTLPDTEGHPVHLADYRGKTVVLEWFNPRCPYVQKSHTKGSLRDAAKRHVADGVVWLGINSGAPGKQGYGADATREGKAKLGVENPVLLDESGTVGHAYGATNTPNLFVISPAGTLVYRGAIDNSPDAEGESPTGGTLVKYVDEALLDVAAGRAVRTPVTKPYGCTVKYANATH